MIDPFVKSGMGENIMLFLSGVVNHRAIYQIQD
jgi:hypothetical protein